MGMRAALIDADSICWAQAWINRDKSEDELCASLDAQITDILLQTKADKYLGVLKNPTETEFRRTMFPAYKGNRPPTPDWYKDRREGILERLTYRWGFVYTKKGFEVDDVLASISDILTRDAMVPIICGVDKDLRQIIAQHYNLKSKEFDSIDVAKAEDSICMQLIHGDTTDNIPNLKYGYGPAKAKKVLTRNHELEHPEGPPIPNYLRVLEEYVKEYGLPVGVVKFAENVLQVVMRRDSEYPYILMDVPENIKKYNPEELFK